MRQSGKEGVGAVVRSFGLGRNPAFGLGRNPEFQPRLTHLFGFEQAFGCCKCGLGFD